MVAVVVLVAVPRLAAALLRPAAAVMAVVIIVARVVLAMAVMAVVIVIVAADAAAPRLAVDVMAAPLRLPPPLPLLPRLRPRAPNRSDRISMDFFRAWSKCLNESNRALSCRNWLAQVTAFKAGSLDEVRLFL